MKHKALLRSQTPQIEFLDLHPKQDDLRTEILSGLQKSPKTVPPKYFYDETGSELFEAICELEEYYPTRIETRLLRTHASEIADILSDNSALIEYGCGSSEKVRILLDAAPGCNTYVAVDISRKPLLELTQTVAECYDGLRLVAVCADFTTPLRLTWPGHSDSRKIAFFPGSSIGNFEPSDARVFLANIANTVGTNGGLLIGVDLKKDQRALHAAYNDVKGVTAQFNKNLLHRINRECNGRFNLDQFSHRAFYNEKEGRIEMHLESLCEQRAWIGDAPIDFGGGETIHTENSYKYDPEEFRALAETAGWNLARRWTDPNGWFSVHYFERATAFPSF